MCDWCGRPLVPEQRQAGRRLWLLGTLAALLALALAAALALFSPTELAGRAGSPTPAPTPTVVLRAEAPPPAIATPTDVAQPSADAAQYVRVANTAGQGVVLRREPSTGAPRVVARRENALLRVVGPDTLVDGRVWRQVEDEQGNRGWTPAEFLSPAEPPAR